MNNKLSLKVKAVNECNKYANEIYPILHEYFKKFVGQKIETVDGNLLKKISDNLPNIKKSDIQENNLNISFMIYRNHSRYSLNYIAKVCVSTGDGCCYHEIYVNIGETRSSILIKVEYYNRYGRIDYTEQEIIDLRNQYKEAKRIADEIESKLSSFGHYDN